MFGRKRIAIQIERLVQCPPIRFTEDPLCCRQDHRFFKLYVLKVKRNVALGGLLESGTSALANQFPSQQKMLQLPDC